MYFALVSFDPATSHISSGRISLVRHPVFCRRRDDLLDSLTGPAGLSSSLDGSSRSRRSNSIRSVISAVTCRQVPTAFSLANLRWRMAPLPMLHSVLLQRQKRRFQLVHGDRLALPHQQLRHQRPGPGSRSASSGSTSCLPASSCSVAKIPSPSKCSTCDVIAVRRSLKRLAFRLPASARTSTRSHSDRFDTSSPKPAPAAAPRPASAPGAGSRSRCRASARRRGELVALDAVAACGGCAAAESSAPSPWHRRCAPGKSWRARSIR